MCAHRSGESPYRYVDPGPPPSGGEGDGAIDVPLPGGARLHGLQLTVPF